MINEEFLKWLKDVGVPTLKREIKDYEQEGFIVGLLLTCEMIYKGNKEAEQE